jgi:hypothetical protein
MVYSISDQVVPKRMAPKLHNGSGFAATCLLGRHLKSVIRQREMVRQIFLRNMVFPQIIIKFKLLIYMCGGQKCRWQLRTWNNNLFWWNLDFQVFLKQLGCKGWGLLSTSQPSLHAASHRGWWESCLWAAFGSFLFFKDDYLLFGFTAFFLFFNYT